MSVRRLNRIFGPDGRAVIVALDHGLIDGPIAGLERPGTTIEAIARGGADAVLASFGVAERFAAELAGVGLILRCDGGATSLDGAGGGPAARFYRPEDAMRLGADAVAISAFPGSPREAASLEMLARTAAEAHRWGLPVLGEMVPGGFDSPPELRTPQAVALAARLGAELGADIVKAPYCEGYERVIEGTFAPVVILGGAKGAERAMLTDIRQAIDAGASGVAIGRNVFQADDPAAMTRAIVALVHDDAAVDEACELLGPGR